MSILEGARDPGFKASVCHLTSAHPRDDTRIFLKECCAIARAGYPTTLVVADGRGNETKGGVAIADVGRSGGRLDRMVNTTRRILDKAIALDADVYHLHDPELVPIGLRLKRRRKKVIFDAHEDLPKQLLGKPYLNRPMKWLLSRVFGAYEAWACRRFDAVVGATPFIREKFVAINPVTVDVNNFPMWGELATPSAWNNKQREVCYVGGIGTNRGIRELVSAMGLLRSDVRLQLCGRFSEPDVEVEVKRDAGWQRVDEWGFVDREGVREVLSRALAGIVTLHPLLNYVDALPVKMFEYMSAGIPVIASNFPLWREIVVGNDCGLCVDPLNPNEIAAAIDSLVGDPDRARAMGENGRAAVQRQYNWSPEEAKLLDLYSRLAGHR